MKTSELTGAALDWAVSKCEYTKPVQIGGSTVMVFKDVPFDYRPSLNWVQGGPIIEAWMIDVGTYHRGAWRAARHVGSAPTYGYGPTPLIAAMRCFVASKMGDDIELPEELT